ncbi:MAG TPA: VOC family protein [Candidatus Limnocylindrales bacterium]|nr:VOC family protein [Candidatus Limnocylindrales bacterium]
MPKVTSLGHIGFYVRDIERSVAFYRDILGLKVSDRSPRGAVFMTAQDRLAEHHELYLAPGRNDDGKANVLQQVSFRCASVADVKEFYRSFVVNKVPIIRCVSHGNTVSIYAEDPDGNPVEVYWPNGVDVPQPFGKPMDLSKSEGEIMAQLDQILAEWRASQEEAAS